MRISRGLRNNNPLNIRRNSTAWKGLSSVQKDRSFFTFIAPEWGYRAAFITLKNYRRKHHLWSLSEWITRWAPPVENDTERYIQTVSSLSSLSKDCCVEINDKLSMCRVVSAMSFVENGCKADEAAVERGWELTLSSAME